MKKEEKTYKLGLTWEELEAQAIANRRKEEYKNKKPRIKKYI